MALYSVCCSYIKRSIFKIPSTSLQNFAEFWFSNELLMNKVPLQQYLYISSKPSNTTPTHNRTSPTLLEKLWPHQQKCNTKQLRDSVVSVALWESFYNVNMLYESVEPAIYGGLFFWSGQEKIKNKIIDFLCPNF